MKQKFCMLFDVYKIVEWRDGCVYKTEKVTSVWLSLHWCANHRDESFRNEIAKKHGGDHLAATMKGGIRTEYFI